MCICVYVYIYIYIVYIYIYYISLSLYIYIYSCRLYLCLSLSLSIYIYIWISCHCLLSYVSYTVLLYITPSYYIISDDIVLFNIMYYIVWPYVMLPYAISCNLSIYGTQRMVSSRCKTSNSLQSKRCILAKIVKNTTSLLPQGEWTVTVRPGICIKGGGLEILPAMSFAYHYSATSCITFAGNREDLRRLSFFHVNDHWGHFSM